MTPPPELLSNLAETKGARAFLANDVRRRGIFILLVGLFVLLSLWPSQHRASVSITPSDPATLGLSGTLGQLGAGFNVFGNQAAVEVALKVARSVLVRQAVSSKLDLPSRLDRNKEKSLLWLSDHVDVRVLRGGIIQISMKYPDPAFALQVVTIYTDAIRSQLALISRNQTAYKRRVLEKLVDDASERLVRAQSTYDNYRRRMQYGDPVGAVGQSSRRVPILEQAILDKKSEINTLRNFNTDSNFRVKTALLELDELQRQFALAKSQNNARGALGEVIVETTRGQKLQRELDLSQGLYDNYRRFLLGTLVEDVASDANIRVLEQPYVDPDLQINWWAAMIAVALLLMAVAYELLKLYPPPGFRVRP
ncbi:hypothetical protein [Sandarakinorhabdus sp.]|uniref:hypothetical protein n=1 Tax=Sandarakinorhabdus sp. TaxID=1916663 RepID=UPI003566228B